MSFISGPCPLLVERDLELKALSRMAREAASDGPRLVVVTGEAGVGKTRLCLEFLDSLPEGWRSILLGGHRTDRSHHAPFEPLVQAVPADDEPARALGQALARALLRDASGAPVVLLIEDLHWLDPVAALALSELMEGVRSETILVIATFRLGSHSLGSSHSRAVAEALRHRHARELRLAGLSPDGVTEMVRLMRGPEIDLGRSLHDRTGGNPFFVEELLRSSDEGVPWTIAEAVIAQLGSLGSDARRAASYLAVATEPLSVGLLVELAGADGVSALINASFAISLDDGRIALRHALVGDALAATLSGGERVGLHRALAEVLESQSSTPAETLAHHWAEAGERVRAAEWATAAADRLSGQRTYRTAVELYRLALEHPPADAGACAALYERAAGAAAIADEADDARLWAERARAAYVEAGQRWRAAGLWVNPVLLKIVDQPPPDPAEGTAASRLIDAQHACARGDYELARHLATGALDAAASLADLTLQATAALTLAYAGAFERGRRALDEIHDVARESGDEQVAAQVLGHVARLAWAMGDIEEATRVQREALVYARRAGDPAVCGHVQAGLALVLAARGELEETEALATDVLTLDIPLVTGGAQLLLGMVEMERGDVISARDRISPIAAAVRAMGMNFFTVLVLGVLARLELLSGNPVAALAASTEADGVMGSALHETRPELILFRARAAEALGDVGALDQSAAEIADLARHATGPGVLTVADAVEAMVARAAGRNDEAAVRFRSAAIGWERAPRWAFAAEAWRDAALTGQVPGAFDRAASIAHDRGFVGLARELSSLREAPSVRAIQSPGMGLTHREADVVHLAADGCSNREIAERLFLSDKTVRNYLSSAFAKLGVHRRAELRPLLERERTRS